MSEEFNTEICSTNPAPQGVYYGDRVDIMHEIAEENEKARQDAIARRATATLRKFSTGATRDTDNDKHDPEGFLSPLVIERYNEYMHKNRYQKDGQIRDSDNWQKGIPKTVYAKSLWRHFLDFWKAHRGLPSREGIETALCAIMFNAMGYLHVLLAEKYGGASMWDGEVTKRYANRKTRG